MANSRQYHSVINYCDMCESGNTLPQREEWSAGLITYSHLSVLCHYIDGP